MPDEPLSEPQSEPQSDAARTGRRAVLIVSAGILVISLIGFAAIHVQPAQAHKSHRRDLVEQFLKEHANEPGSVQIQSVRYGVRSPDDDGRITQLALVEYRQKNTFGATQFSRIILTIVDDRHVEHGVFERNFLAIAGGQDWSSDPDGPKR
jgi:hypothetical protein